MTGFRSVKPRLLWIVGVSAVLAPSASCDIITTVPDIGYVVLSEVFNASRTNFIDGDIRGQTLGTNGFGVAVITDFGSPPFGNSELIGSNPPTTDQFVQLDFIVAGPVLGGPGILVPVTGTALTSITDPVLASLVGRSTAGFSFVGTNPGANQTSIDTYVLTNIESPPPATIPEPSALVLVATSLVLVAFGRLLRRVRRRDRNTSRASPTGARSSVLLVAPS